MAESKTVSIIVPIYNRKRFLKKCIKHTLNQSYRNIELILVNDGSTDGSLEYCKKIAERDSRVVVLTQEHKGVSHARNIALSAATGDYITFLDSDDWLSKHAIASLVEEIEKSDADLALGMIMVMFCHRCVLYRSTEKELPMHDGRRIINHIVQNGFLIHSIAAKLFKTDIIRNNQLRFDEDIKSAEDTCFIFDYLNHCKKISHVYQCAYYCNRFAHDSITGGFYPQMPEWLHAFFERLKRLAGDSLHSDDVQQALENERWRKLVLALRHVVYSPLSKQERKDRIAAGIRLLGDPMPSVNYKKSEKELVMAIKERDDDRIAEYFLRSNNSMTRVGRSLKYLIKNMISAVEQLVLYDLFP